MEKIPTKDVYMNLVYPYYQLRFHKYLVPKDVNALWEQYLAPTEVSFRIDCSIDQIKSDLRKLKEKTQKLNEGFVTPNVMMGYIHEYIIYKRHLGVLQKVKVDKQHWIPECYLKGFADKIDPNSMYRLSKFDISTNTISLVALSEFSTTKKEPNLYEYELEKFFSLMETDYSEVMSSMSEGTEANVWQKIILSVFFTALSFRTKFIMEKMNLGSDDFFDALFSFVEIFALSETVLMKLSNTNLIFSQAPVQILELGDDFTGFYVPLKRGLCLMFLPLAKDKRVSPRSYQGIFMEGFKLSLDRARTLGGLSRLYCNPHDAFFISSQIINSDDEQVPYLLKTPLTRWHEEYPKIFNNHRKVKIKTI